MHIYINIYRIYILHITLEKERPLQEKKKKKKETCETQESNARYFFSFGKEKRNKSSETCHERCRGVLECFFCVCVVRVCGVHVCVCSVCSVCVACVCVCV